MKLKFIQTTFEDNQKTTTEQGFLFDQDPGIENNTINLYPEETDQTFIGFGGAITDAAGYVYSLMNAGQKETFLSTYFSKDELNYSVVRIHLDSCDFSLEHFEAMSNPLDLEMTSFSLERPLKYIEPLLKDVLKMSSNNIEIMVSPWSPPAFMKSNGERNNGGSLLPEYHQFWADYLCRYILVLRKRGYLVNSMTIQNEPKATQKWDSCVYSASEEKSFMRDYLYPTFLRNNLSDVGIFIWDHNKERVYERAVEMIDEETSKMVKGIAFHWYSGDHFEALKLVHKRFPDKILALSEACIEYYRYSSTDYLANAQKYAHDIIGNLNAGMQLFYDWNILLDEIGGPNHVNNYCDAPFLYDTQNKELMPRNTLAYIWHFSHFIQPGATRFEVSRFTDKIEATGFVNPDGSLAVVMLNRTEETFEVVLRINGLCQNVKVLPQSISTSVITK